MLIPSSLPHHKARRPFIKGTLLTAEQTSRNCNYKSNNDRLTNPNFRFRTLALKQQPAGLKKNAIHLRRAKMLRRAII
jgi:hypothetical protein